MILQRRGHMNYTEIVGYRGNLSPEQVRKWRSIEADYPPKIRNAQHEPWMRVQHVLAWVSWYSERSMR